MQRVGHAAHPRRGLDSATFIGDGTGVVLLSAALTPAARPSTLPVCCPARTSSSHGLDVEAQPAVVKEALGRAAVAGMALLRQQFVSGDWAEQVAGWRYPPPEEGRFGDDFLRRAADQCLAGIAANDPAESVYLLNFQDADGAPFAPQGRYQLHFDADELPPVDAFWSLAAYTSADLNLIPNPADRYAVGDHASNLIPDADGGLTLYLQPEAPGGGADGNWLPTSGTHPWFLILRMYRPGATVLDGAWRCPAVTRVDVTVPASTS